MSKIIMLCFLLTVGFFAQGDSETENFKDFVITQKSLVNLKFEGVPPEVGLKVAKLL